MQKFMFIALLKGERNINNMKNTAAQKSVSFSLFLIICEFFQLDLNFLQSNILTLIKQILFIMV